jgi:hypothetical protein
MSRIGSCIAFSSSSDVLAILLWCSFAVLIMAMCLFPTFFCDTVLQTRRQVSVAAICTRLSEQALSKHENHPSHLQIKLCRYTLPNPRGDRCS